MKHFLAILAMSCIAITGFSQEEEEESTTEDTEETKEKAPVSSKEIGVDLNFSASNLGGTGGVGLKFGVVKQEKYILGPSIRYQHSWSKYLNGTPSGYSVYGLGFFAHARLYNYLFVGGEFEYLSTPLVVNGAVSYQQRTWVPVLLVGGGFSRAFGDNFRLNAGIMYDIINNANSPFRPGYFAHKSNGALVPLLYRIAFFFPL